MYGTKALGDTIDIEAIVDDKHSQNLDTSFDYDYVLRHIRLPKKTADIPSIIGWSGPARSGTTALLFLLASHPQIDRAYFQPQKTLMRLGWPSIRLYGKDTTICMKEILCSSVTTKPHDPIEILLEAGVPAEKITWIITLRDPIQTYASWKRDGAEWNPEDFSFWQNHTINLWKKYKDSGVKIVPFVYELLNGREEFVLKKLLSKVGLDTFSFNLDFDQQMIKSKLVPGQAIDEVYFNRSLKRTIGRGRYEYTTNSYPIDSEEARRVAELCQEDYDDFFELAKREIDI